MVLFIKQSKKRRIAATLLLLMFILLITQIQSVGIRKRSHKQIKKIHSSKSDMNINDESLSSQLHQKSAESQIQKESLVSKTWNSIVNLVQIFKYTSISANKQVDIGLMQSQAPSIKQPDYKIVALQLTQSGLSNEDINRIVDMIKSTQEKKNNRIHESDTNEDLSESEQQEYNDVLIEAIESTLDEKEEEMKELEERAEQMRRILPNVNQNCKQYTAQDTCLADQGCGWCPMEDRCVDGDNIAPLYQTCNFYTYHYQADKDCARFTDCSSCLKQDGCGWCVDQSRVMQSCISGDAFFKGCPLYFHSEITNDQCPSSSHPLSEQNEFEIDSNDFENDANNDWEEMMNGVARERAERVQNINEENPSDAQVDAMQAHADLERVEEDLAAVKEDILYLGDKLSYCKDQQRAEFKRFQQEEEQGNTITDNDEMSNEEISTDEASDQASFESEEDKQESSFDSIEQNDIENTEQESTSIEKGDLDSNEDDQGNQSDSVNNQNINTSTDIDTNSDANSQQSESDQQTNATDIQVEADNQNSTIEAN